jgi:dihydropteroate synthase
MNKWSDKSTVFSRLPSKRCGNKDINLDEPVIMGILNLTPDSFYDGGRYPSEKAALERVEKMVIEGAGIIDVGAVSTRPGAQEISLEVEFERLSAALPSIVRRFPDVCISVDTYRSEIAKRSADLGVSMINDISGGTMDPDMFSTIAALGIPYVLMHIQGTPANMQIAPDYTNPVAEIRQYFNNKIAELRSLSFDNIILDPGFGFGKAIEHNYRILHGLHDFKDLDFPLLVGLSRKSMANRLLEIHASDALNATTVLHTLALLEGADILRVHDVKEACQVIRVVQEYRQAGLI